MGEEERRMTKTIIDIEVHFVDKAPTLHISDCDRFDEGWAITFSSGCYSWTIPKSRIEMISVLRRKDG